MYREYAVRYGSGKYHQGIGRVRFMEMDKPPSGSQLGSLIAVILLTSVLNI